MGDEEVFQEKFTETMVHILNIGLIDNTPTVQRIFTTFSAFAHFERDLIVTRKTLLKFMIQVLKRDGLKNLQKNKFNLLMS